MPVSEQGDHAVTQRECEMDDSGVDGAGDGARDEHPPRGIYFMPQPQQTGCRID